MDYAKKNVWNSEAQKLIHGRNGILPWKDFFLRKELTMKNYYKVEVTFYFLLLLIYQDILSDEKKSNQATKAMANNLEAINKKYELEPEFQKYVTYERIKSLLSCVGSIIFIKHKKYYYSRTCELFLLLNSYKTLTSDIQINQDYISNLLQKNLTSFNHDKNDFVNFEKLISNEFFNTIKVKSEVKKINFYVFKHRNLKRKSHND